MHPRRPILARIAWQLPLTMLFTTGLLAQAPGASRAVDDAARYVENLGQWPAAVRFGATFGPVSAWVHADGWTLQVEWSDTGEAGPMGDPGGDQPAFGPRAGAAIRMVVEGGQARDVSALGRPSPARINYLIGNDPTRWVTDARGAAAAILRAVLPGIDAVTRQQHGHFEYDLEIAAGVEIGDAVIRCEGVDSIELQPDGGLLLHTAVGAFRQSPPVAWMEHGNKRVPVQCAVQIVGTHSFRFTAPHRDLGQRLVIDPGIVWATVIGTSSVDHGQGCKPGRDAAGNVYLGGLTTAGLFPTTPGAYQTSSLFNGSQKAWLAKYSPSGTLLWSTYLGGSTNNERLRTLFVQPNGVVTACGNTASVDFPQVNAFDPSFNGAGVLNWGDTWLARLDPTQSGTAQLLWSTYVGGSDDERMDGVHVDANGVVTACGWSYSTNMPGTSLGTAHQATSGGSMDAIVVRLDPSSPPASQLLYFSYFGGIDLDYFNSPAVDANGVITLFGATRSANLSTTANAFSTTLSGLADQMLVRLDPSLPPTAQLTYSTFLGGTGEDGSLGRMVMDDAGVVTCAGWTLSVDFPTTPLAYDTTHNGNYDAVVYRFDPSLGGNNQLVWSTFFGGPNREGANDCVVDPDGGVVFVGSIENGGLPVTSTAFQGTFAGGGAIPSDAYVARLDRTGSQLVYASYLGGTAGVDYAYGLVFDPCGDVFVHGLTQSSNFPASSGTYHAQDDVFVARLSLLPPAMERFGTATADCNRVAQASAESNPTIGNAQFGLSCIGAPPTTVGLLAWSNNTLTSPFQLLGADIWVDPTAGLLLLTGVTDTNGKTFLPIPLPNVGSLVGLEAHTQYAFFAACSPGLLSSACGLSLTIQ